MEIKNVVLIGEPFMTKDIAIKVKSAKDIGEVLEIPNLEQLFTQSLQNYDLIIDTFEGKGSILSERLRTIENIISDQAIFSAYPSDNNVTEITRKLTKPERFIGLHFFRLMSLTDLVEIVKPEGKFNQELLNDIASFLQGAEFATVFVKDRPGLLAYRLLLPYLNQASQSFDGGIATAVDIDNSVKLGLGYPVGPLKLLDGFGINRYIEKADEIYKEIPETKYAVPPVLRRMKSAGLTGIKSGEGFYEYKK